MTDMLSQLRSCEPDKIDPAPGDFAFDRDVDICILGLVPHCLRLVYEVGTQSMYAIL